MKDRIDEKLLDLDKLCEDIDIIFADSNNSIERCLDSFKVLEEVLNAK